jgi:radical SAM protein (TIGR01212 family)
VASTNLPPSASAIAWQSAGLPYHSYNFHLRQRFGHLVHKVSIDAGFTCPNVDGTVARGGCVYCDNRSFSPSRRQPRVAITDQIDEGIRRLSKRFRARHFLAYFQPATNTYAPVERLRPLYESALAHPQIVGLVIGTRPDCVPDEVLDLIAELAQTHYVSLELGLQTIHNRSLDWMNRGHHHDAFLDAMDRARHRGIELCAHVILGLPDESHADMLATAAEVARLDLDAVKLHNLYVVRGTPLADQFQSGQITLLDREQYVRIAVDFLERLPSRCVVERISADAPPDYFIAPEWCLNKPAIRDAILAEFQRRGTRQGSRYHATDSQAISSPLA